MWNGDMHPSANVVLRSGVTCSAEAQQRRQQDRRQQRPNRAAVQGQRLFCALMALGTLSIGVRSSHATAVFKSLALLAGAPCFPQFVPVYPFETVTMRAIIRRLRRLEEDRVERQQEAGPNLAELLGNDVGVAPKRVASLLGSVCRGSFLNNIS